MSRTPKVTVLMSIYNGEQYVRQAIDSILAQTFKDFEFLIIDDGSTDSSAQIVKSYDDPRVILMRNKQNIGLAASLNRGLESAVGEYVARTDSDDISLPTRLEQQVAFMDSHSEIGLLGSACVQTDVAGSVQGLWRVPVNDIAIRWESLLASPFLHPTVVIRHEVLARHHLRYDDSFEAAQDYDLWTRMLRFTRGANLDLGLVHYRLSQGITKRKRQIQLKNHDFIAHRTIREELSGFAVEPTAVTRLRESFVGGQEEVGLTDVERIRQCRLFLDMLRAFVRRHKGEDGLRNLVREQALKVARNLPRLCWQSECLAVLYRLVLMNPTLPLIPLRQLGAMLRSGDGVRLQH